MARKKRSDMFKPGVRGTYHVYSRCARGGWFLSKEERERRDELLALVKEFGGIYGIAVVMACFLSNHFHLILINLPELVDKWSDEEVLIRARRAYPHRFAKMKIYREPTDEQMAELLRDESLIREMRSRMSDISWMLRIIKQRFAAKANLEDGESGHFWSGRFEMVEITSEAHLITAMVYLALNQIRAGEASTMDASFWTSVCWQLQAREMQLAGDAEGAEDHDGFLVPFTDTATPKVRAGKLGSRRARDEPVVEMTLDQFVQLAESVAAIPDGKAESAKPPKPLEPILHRVGLTMATLSLAVDGIL